MTLDEFITELTALKAAVGGAATVLVSSDEEGNKITSVADVDAMMYCNVDGEYELYVTAEAIKASPATYVDHELPPEDAQHAVLIWP